MKIRGTAQHVAEKYLQLARDAQSSGDIVLAENLLQHAEHYFRLIAAAQQQQTNGYGRQSFETDVEEEDDDDFAGVPDRFAPLSERLPTPPAYSPQTYQAPQPPTPQHFTPPPQQPQPFEERPISGGEAPRHERPINEAQQRHERPSRPQFGGRGRGGYDRGGADRSGEGQGEQGGRQPRFGFDRGRDRNGFNSRRDQAAGEAPPSVAAEPPSGLPAFITAPTAASVVQRTAPVDLPSSTPAEEARPGENNAGADFHLAARRRRRIREDHEGEATPTPSEVPSTE